MVLKTLSLGPYRTFSGAKWVFWIESLGGFSRRFLGRSPISGCNFEALSRETSTHKHFGGTVLGMGGGSQSCPCVFLAHALVGEEENTYTKSPENPRTMPGPAPLQKCVGDFCCIDFGGFCRGFSWRMIFLGTFSCKK